MKSQLLQTPHTKPSKTVLQLGVLLLFWYVGGVLQHALRLPISAGVVGLFLALAALLSGLLKLEWIKSGADWVLGELVLFFIPCVVGLMKYQALFRSQGWQLLTTIVIGTVCVMVVTAYAVALGFKLENRLKQRFLAHKTLGHHE